MLFDLNIGFLSIKDISASSNLLLVRTFLFLFGIVPLTAYLTYDYSSFFEDHLEMDVYYDKGGLDKSLNVFTKKELQHLKILIHNYKRQQVEYYKELDKKLIKENLLNEGDSFFSVSNLVIHSVGCTSFIVEKTKNSFQDYTIKESKGFITHELEAALLTKCYFTSTFHKINSPDDHLRPTLFEIFFKHQIVIKPQFHQTISVKNILKGVEGHHTLHGLTKISFFPYPRYYNTIYLYEDNGKFIPIGYAVYH